MPLADPTPADTELADTESADIVWDDVFVIGVEDRSWGEFSTECHDQAQEFICYIDVDCTAEDIPSGIYREKPNPSYYDEVPKLTKVFRLNRDYSELLLRLARGGSETMSVSVDGGEPQFVTSKMLGSSDGWVVGSHDLQLGPLQAGSHSIAFAMSDSEGDGEFGWDALSLTAR